MNVFHHEKLDVYQTSLELIVAADAIATQLATGRGYLADQLRRAATSVALNIAEGAGEFSRKDKARLYRIARRSATECAAVFDICMRLDLAAECDLHDARQLVHRIVSMLTRIARVQSGTGTETDTETGSRDAIRLP